ncbi:MAG: hypothetical protein V4475_10985 [Pseudomonadota bacterium]
MTRPTAYFAPFFTRQYWRTLGHMLFAMAFTSWALREEFWDRVDREADGEPPPPGADHP